MLLISSQACKGKNSEKSSDAMVNSEASASYDSYTVKGRVEEITPTETGVKLSVHHEEIPEFADQGGKKVGMMSMTMEFALDPEKTPAKDLKVKDNIELTFQTRWKETPRLFITDFSKLPAETELTLSGY